MSKEMKDLVACDNWVRRRNNSQMHGSPPCLNAGAGARFPGVTLGVKLRKLYEMTCRTEHVKSPGSVYITLCLRGGNQFQFEPLQSPAWQICRQWCP